MNFINPELHSRRAFLKRSGQLAMTGTALPWALNLAAISDAAAFNATDSNGASDYKALVCIFLSGGNDHANTVVPYDDSSYNLYSTIRQGGAGQTAGGIALAKASLGATLLNATPRDALNWNNCQFALNPAMTGLSSLFNSGQLAVQLNVGPLIKPLTRAQYDSSDRKNYPRPARLFSHNDQTSTWQSSGTEGTKAGWGGRLGDLALANNTNSTFSCMSLAGNSVFLAGNTALRYQLSTSGAVKVDPADSTVYSFGSAAVRDAISKLIQQRRSHVLEDAYNIVTARSLTAEDVVTNALKLTTPAAGSPAPTNSLSDQLKMVARLIAGRSVLDVRRQVFMVSLGGFDMHDNLIRDHGGKLGQLSSAMDAFYTSINGMGLANKVTTFTASDFGRTLASNGDGSDHGWGSHHFVMGGAVKGQQFYGVAPPISTSNDKTENDYKLENQSHVGQGRLLPTTSVDEYGATLAKWFGVGESEMAQIFPNIGNFASTYAGGYMGFMQSN